MFFNLFDQWPVSLSMVVPSLQEIRSMTFGVRLGGGEVLILVYYFIVFIVKG